MVTMIYHHPEDEYEILSLKKVLTSTLSAKVVVSFPVGHLSRPIGSLSPPFVLFVSGAFVTLFFSKLF